MSQERVLHFTGAELCRLGACTGDRQRRGADPTRGLSALETRARELGGEYALSVPLSFSCRLAGLPVEIGFLCPGVQKLGESYSLDWAVAPGDAYAPLEARLAGAALCRSRKLSALTLRLVQGVGESLRLQEKTYPAQELLGHLNAALENLGGLLLRCDLADRRVRFPYPGLREGQRELMEQAYDALKHRSQLLVCAPTGLGKTLSFLYPALKAVEKGRCSRVIFVTPKGSTQAQVARAARQLGYGRSLVLGAKQSLCPRGERCLQDRCAQALGHESRLQQALAAFLTCEELNPDSARRVGQSFGVCPFQLSVRAARLCTVVVGDYNFVFDPKARLDSLADGNCALLVDEAHNLPDRVRESLSVTVGPEQTRAWAELFGGECREELGALEELWQENRRARENGAPRFVCRYPEILGQRCRDLARRLGPLCPVGDAPRADALATLRRVAALEGEFDTGYVCAYAEDGGVHLYLCHPAHAVSQGVQAFGPAVFFSATLAPREYFAPLLGARENDRYFQAQSPFDPERMLVCTAPLATTLARRQQSLPQLCTLVKAACQRPGRYLCFFPSFEYLQGAEQALARLCPQLKRIGQKPGMGPEQRRDFLRRLSQPTEGQSLVGLCVLGGLFGEGVELEVPLSGVVVIGTGMPPPSWQQEAAAAYYAHQDMDAQAFSSALPGFHRVLQAVGRLIRRETDAGVAVLCDDRFCEPGLQSLFPAHWQEPVVCENPFQVKTALRRFWDRL